MKSTFFVKLFRNYLSAQHDGGYALINFDFPEIAGAVAAFALLTETAIVHILLAMTAATGQGRTELFFYRPIMAGQASGLAVGAIELEPGAQVVIEVPGFPGTGVVAAVALRTKALLVHILFVMTAVTGHGGVAEGRSGVALGARRRDMCAGQRESRPGVIVGCVAPVSFVMTAFAPVAQLGLVPVILLVTDDATGFQFELVNRPELRPMAIVALGLQMLAAQQILGVAIMIEAAGRPPFLAMTGSAGLAVAPLVPLSAVILAMADNAGRFQLEPGFRAGHPAQMAGFAFRRLVLVTQGKAGVLVMIEGRVLPTFLVVAGFALVAQPAAVPLFLIVLLVATDAFLRQLLLVKHPFFGRMATVALGFLMLAAQRQAGVGVMVESQFFPAPVTVTDLALVAVTPLVAAILIVLAVAAAAIARSILVTPVAVAFPAFDIGMFAAGNGEAGLFVIEPGLLPVFFIVAFAALFAEATLVHIVLAMAGVAIGGCFAILALLVAILAPGFLVPVTQDEVRLPMIERVLVEGRYFSFATHVLAVAGAAFLFLLATMKTLASPYIRRNLLVAIKAEAGLRSLVEAHVTALAIFLVPGMPRNHLARHQCSLDELSLGRPRRKRDQQQKEAEYQTGALA